MIRNKKQSSIYRAAIKAGVAALACTAFCGAVGVVAISILDGQIAYTERTAHILRNHLESDMMHDALRSDVMAAIASGNDLAGISLSDVHADLEDHVQHFNEMLTANSDLAAGTDIAPIVQDLKQPLADYISAASSIVEMARSDLDAASMRVPDFYSAFARLEDMMSIASDKIQATSASAAASANFIGTVMLAVMVLAAIATVAVIAFIILGAKNYLVTPIVDLTTAMDRLAGGDLDLEPPHRSRDDEVGRMAASLSKFRESARLRNSLEAEQRAVDLKQQERARYLSSTAAEFGDHMSASVSTLREASRLLSQNAIELEAVCRDASSSAEEALHATNGSTDNVRTIAAATTELSASIQEIASRMSESARSAERAATEGKAADSTSLELVGATRDIDHIVSLISSVAEQTNLLALNATIEAARAGEMGRGFSVVASEVKELAAQTSKATEDVSGRIGQIQSISARSQSQLKAMLQMIEQIKQFSMAVAAAAEQQSTATNSISDNVHSAAERAEVALASVHAMGSVTEKARTTTASVQSHARSVEQLAENLDRATADFLSRIQAA